ncbi:sensor histidine kinase [Corallococcus sp. bb12-1]|uniref:sensor histidine kinase n=1 Tax=Corallococcus sp. bb12-1 TaxID=2996784 RepID=UPI00226DA102|nr:HAMP domain-containing sensor histidine kinase [Corallococcus sp. bb12-1]
MAVEGQVEVEGQDERQQQLWRRARVLATSAAALTLVLGLAVLVGWAADSRVLTQVRPGFPAMVPMTALGLMFTALAELALGTKRPGWRRAGSLLGLAVALQAGLVLTTYAWSTVAAHGLLRELGGRTSPQTATGLLLLGLALALRDAPGRGARVFQALALSALGVSFTLLLAYTFQERRFYQFDAYGTGTAVHSAVGLMLLAVGAVLLRPERGFVSVVLRAGAGGMMARRLLPALLLPVLGVLLVDRAIRQEALDPRLAWSILEVAQTVVLAFVVWRAAARLNALQVEQQRSEARSEDDARTQRRLAQENARLHARAEEASQAREDALAVVSHDLKNPLTTIRLGTRLLARRLQATPGTQGFQQQVDSIDRAARCMQDLIHQLLDAARLDAGRELVMDRMPEPLEALTREALELVASQATERNLRLEHTVPGELRVFCDRPRVLQVLANLLGNAVKFTPRGGTVMVSATRDGEAVRVSVRDTGPGIPQADQAHLFKRHWQARDTAEQGSGLGLYIACGIVTAHGGQLAVASDEGAGTTFTFTLPLPPGDFPAHPGLDSLGSQI